MPVKKDQTSGLPSNQTKRGLQTNDAIQSSSDDCHLSDETADGTDSVKSNVDESQVDLRKDSTQIGPKDSFKQFQVKRQKEKPKPVAGKAIEGKRSRGKRSRSTYEKLYTSVKLRKQESKSDGIPPAKKQRTTLGVQTRNCKNFQADRRKDNRAQIGQEQSFKEFQAKRPVWQPREEPKPVAGEKRARATFEKSDTTVQLRKQE